MEIFIYFTFFLKCNKMEFHEKKYNGACLYTLFSKIHIICYRTKQEYKIFTILFSGNKCKSSKLFENPAVLLELISLNDWYFCCFGSKGSLRILVLYQAVTQKERERKYRKKEKNS